MSDFDNRNFPDAVDSDDVGWMIVEWRIERDRKRCEDCGGDYSLYSSQFEDLPKGTTAEQARRMLRRYVKNRREHISTSCDGPIRTSLFLLRVDRVANITDDENNLFDDVEVVNHV